MACVLRAHNNVRPVSVKVLRARLGSLGSLFPERSPLQSAAPPLLVPTAQAAAGRPRRRRPAPVQRRRPALSSAPIHRTASRKRGQSIAWFVRAFVLLVDRIAAALLLPSRGPASCA